VSDKAAQEIRKFLGAFEKLQKATIRFVLSVSLSVRPHGTTRLSGQIFVQCDIWVFFSEICLENPSFIKFRQE
jgi:hypothetical protein